MRIGKLPSGITMRIFTVVWNKILPTCQMWIKFPKITFETAVKIWYKIGPKFAFENKQRKRQQCNTCALSPQLKSKRARDFENKIVRWKMVIFRTIKQIFIFFGHSITLFSRLKIWVTIWRLIVFEVQKVCVW